MGFSVVAFIDEMCMCVVASRNGSGSCSFLSVNHYGGSGRRRSVARPPPRLRKTRLKIVKETRKLSKRERLFGGRSALYFGSTL
jgi:hypothetical protein